MNEHERPRVAELCTLVLAGAAALYATLVSAGPQLFDAGELVAASVELGASHPPGQPLHAFLAHAFTWLPLGPLPARIALFSAACMLWALSLAARITRELASLLEASPTASALSQAAAIACLGLATPLLRQALRPEVYGLALALTLWSALHLLRFLRGGTYGHLYFAAFCSGLAASVHPPHGLCAALFGVGIAVARPERLRAHPRCIAGALLGALGGLLCYAYLPLRGAAGAATWGRPTDLPGFIAYVTARAYAMNTIESEGAAFLPALRDFGLHLLETGGAIALIGALLSLRAMRDARRRVLAGLVLGAILCLLAASIQPFELQNPDNVAYLGPALSLLCAIGAAGYAALARGASAPLAAGGLLALFANPYSLSHSASYLDGDLPALETLAGSLLDTPPARALIVATTDFTAASVMMAKAVDGARPDTALLVYGLSTSSWHWERLQQHPALSGEPVRAPVGDPYRAYTRGAVAAAVTRIPVALERDLQGVIAPAQAGAYGLLPPGRVPALGGLLTHSIGERVHDEIARSAARGPGGDSEAAAAIVRDYLCYRGQRLLRLGYPRRALRSFQQSLWPLGPAAREELEQTRSSLPEQGQPRNLPPRVEEPDSFLVSRAEAVRATAAALWVLGKPEPGGHLLERQAARGDPRALLQLAWLQLYAGDTKQARATFEALVQEVPELRAEAADLERALSRP